MGRTNLGLVLASAGIAAATLGGCTPRRGLVTETNYQRPATRLVTPGNIKDHELRRVTEQDSRYALEGVVIHGIPMYEQTNANPLNDEYGTFFILKRDHVRQVDDLTGETRITSDAIYIPTLVTTLLGEPAHTLPLSTTGKYGVRSRVTQHKTKGVQTGVFRETQKDATLNLLTMTLEGKEFYLPRVEAEELERLAKLEENLEEQDSLPFYMVPVVGTRKDISNNGEVTLWSRAGIFRALRTNRSDYNSRQPVDVEPPKEETLEEGKNPGQALTPN